MESEGNVELRGGVEIGGEVPILGNGCRLFEGECKGTSCCETGLAGGMALAVLPLLPRYSAIRSWKDELTGEKFWGVDTLFKSSADLDHPFRDMLRRSPKPPVPLVLGIGLDGTLGAWNLDSSTEFCWRIDRSCTDLAIDAFSTSLSC